jgi:hypothetical protein
MVVTEHGHHSLFWADKMILAGKGSVAGRTGAAAALLTRFLLWVVSEAPGADVSHVIIGTVRYNQWPERVSMQNR